MNYQNVIIKLNNGKEIIATIPETLTESEIKGGEIRAVSVGFTKPRKIPDGCRFEPYDEEEE